MFFSRSARFACVAAMLTCVVVSGGAPAFGTVVDIKNLPDLAGVVINQSVSVNNNLSAEEKARQIVDLHSMRDANGSKTGQVNVAALQEFAKASSAEVRAQIWQEIKKTEDNSPYSQIDLTKLANTMVGTTNTERVSQATMFLQGFSKQELKDMKQYVSKNEKAELNSIIAATPDDKPSITANIFLPTR